MPGLVTGTIGSEEVRLENAATESTLELLVQSMEKVAKGLKVQGKDYAKELKSLKEEADQRDKHTKELKEAEETQRDLNKELDASKKKYKEVATDLDNVARTLAKGVSKIFSATTPTIAGFAAAFDGIPFVGGVISSLGGVLGEQVDVYRKLSGSGIMLGDTLFSTTEAAARANIPLEVFANALKNNADALARFGGNASEGARRFTEISFRMKKDGVQDKMMRLGYSMEEVANHTAGYIELQSKLGQSQRKSDAELAAGAEEYLLQLDELSRATGLEKSEVEKRLGSMREDMRLKTLMMSMDSSARKSLEGVLVSLQDADLKEAVTELVATGGLPIKNELARSIAMFSPELRKASAGLRSGAITQDQFNAVMRKESVRFADEMKNNGEYYSRMKAVGVNSFDAMIKLAGYYENFVEGDAEQRAARQKQIMENNQLAAAGMDAALNQIKSAFVEGFIKTGILQQFASGMSFVVQGIGRFLNDLQNFDISTAIANLFDPSGAFERDEKGNVVQEKDEKGNVIGDKKVTSRSIFELIELPLASGIKDLFTNPKTYLVLGGAITALFAGAVIKKAVVGSISNLVGSAAGKLTVGKATDAAAGAAGKGAATLGVGAGKGIQGLFAGLANGIKMFGTIPFAALAKGGIVLAGITAAIWVMSDAFQKAGPYFKDFSEVINVAFSRIADIATSIGTTIVNIITSIGGVVSGTINSITEGIANIVGKFTEFKTAGISATTDQIERLASIPSGTLTQTAEGVAALKTALADFSPGVMAGFSQFVGKAFAGDQTASLERLASSGPGIQQLAASLKELDFNKINTANIDPAKLETLKTALKDVNFGKFDISAIDPAKFQALSTALAGIDFSKIDTSKVNIDVAKINELKSALVGIDFKKLNLDAIQNIDSSPMASLASSLKEIDFSNLDASNINFDSFTIGAKKVRELSTALASARTEMSQMSKPSLADSVSAALDKVSTNIMAAVTPTTAPAGGSSEEKVLKEIDTKLGQLNMSMISLLEIQDSAKDKMGDAAKYAKMSSGRLA